LVRGWIEAAVVGLVVVACGSSASSTGKDDTGGTMTTSDGTDGTGDTGSTPSSTSSAETTATTPPTTGSGNTDEIPPECVEDGPVRGGHSVEDADAVEPSDLAADSVCGVVRYEPVDSRYEAELFCPDEPGPTQRYVIQLFSTEAIERPIVPGAQIHFTHQSELWPDGYFGWFTLRRPTDDTLLVAGVSEWGQSWPVDPFEVEIVGPLCPVEEIECGPWQRGAYDVSFEGGTVTRVFDGNRADIGDDYVFLGYTVGWLNEVTNDDCSEEAPGLTTHFEIVRSSP